MPIHWLRDTLQWPTFEVIGLENWPLELTSEFGTKIFPDVMLIWSFVPHTSERLQAGLIHWDESCRNLGDF